MSRIASQLAARRRAPGLDGLEQYGEVARGRRVVHAGSERRSVLDAPQDLDVRGAESVRRGVGVPGADQLDERVRREVARPRDHVVHEVAKRDAGSYKAVSQAVGIVGRR